MNILRIHHDQDSGRWGATWITDTQETLRLNGCLSIEEVEQATVELQLPVDLVEWNNDLSIPH